MTPIIRSSCWRHFSHLLRIDDFGQARFLRARYSDRIRLKHRSWPPGHDGVLFSHHRSPAFGALLLVAWKPRLVRRRCPARWTSTFTSRAGAGSGSTHSAGASTATTSSSSSCPWTASPRRPRSVSSWHLICLLSPLSKSDSLTGDFFQPIPFKKF